MTKSGVGFLFEPWAGDKCENQEQLTKYYCQLYSEAPSINCIISYKGKTGFATFDGRYWRKLDLNALVEEGNK